MYGPSAWWGADNEGAPLLPEGEMAFDAETEYQTNNGLWAYSAEHCGS